MDALSRLLRSGNRLTTAAISNIITVSETYCITVDFIEYPLLLLISCNYWYERTRSVSDHSWEVLSETDEASVRIALHPAFLCLSSYFDKISQLNAQITLDWLT